MSITGNVNHDTCPPEAICYAAFFLEPSSREKMGRRGILHSNAFRPLADPGALTRKMQQTEQKKIAVISWNLSVASCQLHVVKIKSSGWYKEAGDALQHEGHSSGEMVCFGSLSLAFQLTCID